MKAADFSFLMGHIEDLSLLKGYIEGAYSLRLMVT